jgi:polyphosphate glucokinase
VSKRVLVLDVGGTHVKVYATGHPEPIKSPSGRGLTPRRMVADALRAASSSGWEYDAVSIGIPAPVARGRVLREPANLGPGWTRFDFASATSKPVTIMNDAAMQALGSYQGGTMLFLGLGTGLGSALIMEGTLVPLELARLPYRNGDMEDRLRGLLKYGKRRWRRFVADVVAALRSALNVDYVVLGGGNTRRLKMLPETCRLGSNAPALVGGERLWSEKPAGGARPDAKAMPPRAVRRPRGKRAIP